MTIVGSWLFLCTVCPMQHGGSTISNAYNLCYNACMSTSFLADRHQSLSVLFIRSSKIHQTKHADDHLGKHTHTLESNIFTNAEILIDRSRECHM
jgi:hypothetical protein